MSTCLNSLLALLGFKGGGVEEGSLAKWNIHIQKKNTLYLLNQLITDKVPLQMCPHIIATGGHAQVSVLFQVRTPADSAATGVRSN